MFSVCYLSASNNRQSLLSHFSEKDTATERLNNSGAARIWKQGSESRGPPFATTLNFSHLQVSENAQKKVSSQGRCGTSDLLNTLHSIGTMENVFGEPVQSLPLLQESFYRMGQRLAGVLTPQLSHHLHPHCWESAVGPESVASCKFLNLNPEANCHQGCFEA